MALKTWEYECLLGGSQYVRGLSMDKRVAAAERKEFLWSPFFRIPYLQSPCSVQRKDDEPSYRGDCRSI